MYPKKTVCHFLNFSHPFHAIEKILRGHPLDPGNRFLLHETKNSVSKVFVFFFHFFTFSVSRIVLRA